jgi:hypothetical protein
MAEVKAKALLKGRTMLEAENVSDQQMQIEVYAWLP